MDKMKPQYTRIATNVFLMVMISCAFFFGVFEKYISPGFDEQKYKDHILFKDDTRAVRDQDFWPFSSYPMFSDAYDDSRVSRIEARGITLDNEEVLLPISKLFYPLWENGLHRMLKKAVVHEKDIKTILDSLGRLYVSRYHYNPWFEDKRDSYPMLKEVSWYVQLWSWEEWLNFRKTHANLNLWSDFKKSSFRPLYHEQLHSTVITDE